MVEANVVFRIIISETISTSLCQRASAVIAANVVETRPTPRAANPQALIDLGLTVGSRISCWTFTSIA